MRDEREVRGCYAAAWFLTNTSRDEHITYSTGFGFILNVFIIAPHTRTDKKPLCFNKGCFFNKIKTLVYDDML